MVRSSVQIPKHPWLIETVPMEKKLPNIDDDDIPSGKHTKNYGKIHHAING